MLRIKLLTSVIVILITFFVSCGRSESTIKEKQATQAEIDSLKKEKEKLTEKLELEKKMIDNKIEDLREEKVRQTGMETQEFYEESIQKLETSSDSLDKKIARFENETKKDWNQLKKEMNEALESADRELNDVGKAIEDFFRKDDKK